MADESWREAFPEVPTDELDAPGMWSDPNFSLSKSANIGWGAALATALQSAGRPTHSGAAPATRPEPVDWRRLMRSGQLHALQLEQALISGGAGAAAGAAAAAAAAAAAGGGGGGATTASASAAAAAGAAASAAARKRSGAPPSEAPLPPLRRARASTDGGNGTDLAGALDDDDDGGVGGGGGGRGSGGGGGGSGGSDDDDDFGGAMHQPIFADGGEGGDPSAAAGGGGADTRGGAGATTATAAAKRGGGGAPSSAALERDAARARAIQEKNRHNQRRHRERQRSKLAAAEERVAELEAVLATTKAENEKLLARVVTSEAGGVPRSTLSGMLDANAELRAALRGCSFAEARRSVEAMHLKELVQDRRMCAAALAELVEDPTHADPSSPAGRRLGEIMEARHKTVRGFFASAVKPMHMMFAAFERHDAAAGGPAAMATFAKWFHVLRSLELSPSQADALLAARGRYLAALERCRHERQQLKAALEATEPSRDTFGARSLRQLTAQSAAEALCAVLQREDAAAADLEKTAMRVLSHAQFALAYVAGAPSMPDWLAVANLLSNDPSGPGGSGMGAGNTTNSGSAGVAGTGGGDGGGSGVAAAGGAANGAAEAPEQSGANDGSDRAGASGFDGGGGNVDAAAAANANGSRPASCSIAAGAARNTLELYSKASLDAEAADAAAPCGAAARIEPIV